jgi:hypothetical protein
MAKRPQMKLPVTQEWWQMPFVTLDLIKLETLYKATLTKSELWRMAMAISSSRRL